MLTSPPDCLRVMLVPPVRLERTLLAELDFESSASTIPPRGRRSAASLAENGAARQAAKLRWFDHIARGRPTHVDTQANIPLARQGDASGSWAGREALAEIARTAHIRQMIDRATWKRWLTHPVVDWTIFILGVILILLSPVVGALPGPGGVFVLALGLAMVLRTSSWARRRYVQFKRWQPKAGRWTDWGLRRKSAQRREALAKEQMALDETESSAAVGPIVATNSTASQSNPGN